MTLAKSGPMCLANYEDIFATMRKRLVGVVYGLRRYGTSEDELRSGPLPLAKLGDVVPWSWR